MRTGKGKEITFQDVASNTFQINKYQLQFMVRHQLRERSETMLQKTHDEIQTGLRDNYTHNLRGFTKASHMRSETANHRTSNST